MKTIVTVCGFFMGKNGRHESCGYVQFNIYLTSMHLRPLINSTLAVILLTLGYAQPKPQLF